MLLKSHNVIFLFLTKNDFATQLFNTSEQKKTKTQVLGDTFVKAFTLGWIYVLEICYRQEEKHKMGHCGNFDASQDEGLELQISPVNYETH